MGQERTRGQRSRRMPASEQQQVRDKITRVSGASGHRCRSRSVPLPMPSSPSTQAAQPSGEPPHAALPPRARLGAARELVQSVHVALDVKLDDAAHAGALVGVEAVGMGGGGGEGDRR